MLKRTAFAAACEPRPLRNRYRRYVTAAAEGTLTEQYLLDNVGPLLDVMRGCNVAIRWGLLHHTGRSGRARARGAANGIDAEKLMTLLLKTSQLEYKLKAMFQSVLDTKEADKWDFCKNQVTR